MYFPMHPDSIFPVTLPSQGARPLLDNVVLIVHIIRYNPCCQGISGNTSQQCDENGQCWNQFFPDNAAQMRTVINIVGWNNVKRIKVTMPHSLASISLQDCHSDHQDSDHIPMQGIIAHDKCIAPVKHTTSYPYCPSYKSGIFPFSQRIINWLFHIKGNGNDGDCT